jgi:hypothetical protein
MRTERVQYHYVTRQLCITGIDMSPSDLDVQQLIRFAKHYLKAANRLKVPHRDLNNKIGILFDEYRSNSKSTIYLFMAHLASAAFRAATITESCKLEKYNYRSLANSSDIEQQLNSKLDLYMPMLLRDLVGHTLKNSHPLSQPRLSVVHNLTPVECRDHLTNAIFSIATEL